MGPPVDYDLTDYDPTDPTTDRRRDQIAGLHRDLKELRQSVSRNTWGKWIPTILGALSIIGILLTGYAGYIQLQSTVEKHTTDIDYLYLNSVTDQELSLELAARDVRMQALENTVTQNLENTRAGLARIEKGMENLSAKLDRLIEGHIGKK